MYPWTRRSSNVSYRSIKSKIQNIPQQLCKLCLRCTARVCEDEGTRYCVIFFIFCTLCFVLFGWIFLRDTCYQWEIRNTLCEDYRRGLVAGSLCYNLCIDEVRYLSSCLKETDQVITFTWEESLVKARRLSYDLDPRHSLWEGITLNELRDVLEVFFMDKLGPNDHSNVIDRVIQFSDFNEDNKVQYGEIYSVWQLLQIPEFFTLFLFQKNSIFPDLNGTCGTMYVFENTYYKSLYVKTQSSILDYVFPNRFRWGFPDFAQRAHLALGLLQYAYTAMETENSRFYMCDFSTQNFGYSQYYHMKVSNLDGVVSETVLNKSLTSIPCHDDLVCIYGTVCKSQCNRDTGHCRGISLDHKPDLVQVCEILFDFILYNTPDHLKSTLQHLISQCYRIGRRGLGKSELQLQLEQNYVIDNLNDVLWNELKNEKNPWMYKPTPSPYRK